MKSFFYQLVAIFAVISWCSNLQTIQAQACTITCASCPATPAYENCGNLGTAIYYWAGASPANPSGEFNDACNWRVGSLTGKIPCQAPNTTNEVVFSAAAFASATLGSTITIGIGSGSVQNANCKSMLWEAGVSNTQASVISVTGHTTAISNLNVYGDFTLVPTTSKLAFRYNGNISFRSTTPGLVCNITNAGQQFLIRNFVVEVGANTEVRLLDALYVDNTAANQANNNEGAFILNSGYFNTNAQPMRVDFFQSLTTGAVGLTRQLKIAGSKIDVCGVGTSASWSVNFNASPANFNVGGVGFDATGSNIHFPAVLASSHGFIGGTGSAGVYYDTISTGISNTGLFYFSGGSAWMKHAILGRSVTIAGTNIVADNLYLWGRRDYVSNTGSNTITTESVVVNAVQCQEFAQIVGENSSKLTIVKKTPGILNFEKCILVGTLCDISGGRTYTAIASIDAGVAGSNQNWASISPAPCVGTDFYFFPRLPVVATASAVWSRFENWNNWNGTAFVPATRIPSALDNVYFDNNSFNTTYQKILVDSMAYCHNFRVLSSIPALTNRVRLRINGLGDNRYAPPLNIFGTMELDPKMAIDTIAVTGFAEYLDIALWGAGDSIITKGVPILPTLNLRAYSDYTIHGDLRARWLYGRASSMMRANNNNWIINLLWAARRTLHNIQADLLAWRNSPSVYFPYREVSGFDPVNSYTGTTTFSFIRDTFPIYLSASNCQNCGVTNYDSVVHLPNVIFYADIAGVRRDLVIHGNADFRGNADLYNTWETGAGTLDQSFIMTGTMSVTNPSFNGNLTFAAGKQYTFSGIERGGADNSELFVNGNLNSVGNCVQSTSLRTNTGNGIKITVSGTSDIQYNYINAFDNTGNPIITALNSTNGNASQNLNINFPPTTGTTYYWRASGFSAAAPGDLVGNWSDPCHWTNNPASLVGNCACVPTSADSVVFDNLSGTGVADTCCIDLGYCKSLSVLAQVRLHTIRTTNRVNIDNGKGNLYIENNLFFYANLVKYQYNGIINFVGAGFGLITTNGTLFRNKNIVFSNTQGNWSLGDNFTLAVERKGIYFSNTTEDFTDFAGIDLQAGRLNLNGQTLQIGNQFTSEGNQPRILDITNSTIYMDCNGTNIVFSSSLSAIPWNIPINSTNITVTAPNSSLFFRNDTLTGLEYPKTLTMGVTNSVPNGVSIAYGLVEIDLNDETVNLQGSTDYNFLRLKSNVNITTSNTADSIYFLGGFNYVFTNSTVQTLRSPFGKILRDGGNGFVNLRSTNTGSKAYFRKQFGYYFCLDYMRVSDVGAYSNTAASPFYAATQTFTYPSAGSTVTQASFGTMRFYTGTNSDNVNNSVSGDLWDFSLGFAAHTLVNSSQNACMPAETVTITCPILGDALDGYIIRYTWAGISATGASGTITVNQADDDNNGLTPYNFSVTMTANVAGTMTFEVAALRCGTQTQFVTATALVGIQTPNQLVNIVTEGACTLNNQAFYLDFYSQDNARPIASVQDFVGAGDVSSLGLTRALVGLDNTLQQIDGGASFGANRIRPRLPRNWQIIPTSNGQANVRVYFTQTELAQLSAATFSGAYGGLGISELQIWKFTDGHMGTNTPYGGATPSAPLSAPEVLTYGASSSLTTFTTVDMSSSTAGFANDKAFASGALNGVIAIEFKVNSFSHFVLVPTPSALLPNDLLSFEARAIDNKIGRVEWTVDNHQTAARFVLERSEDAVHFSDIAEITAKNTHSQQVDYQYDDLNPLVGVAYYRLRRINQDGQIAYSDARSVEIKRNLSVVKVFPNPTQAQKGLNLQLQTETPEELDIQILDNLGRVIYRQQQIVQGITTFQLPTQGLAPATYRLKITNAQAETIHRAFIIE